MEENQLECIPLEGQGRLVFHDTNDKGYKAIGSQTIWLFKASKPPCDHAKAAYFTNLRPETRNLAKRLFVRGCSDKVTFVFCFSGGDDLTPLDGGRGTFIFFSLHDYPVEEARQGLHGETDKVKEEST